MANCETWRAYTCFYCKGKPDKVTACATCAGWGYIRVSLDGSRIEPQPWPLEPEERKLGAQHHWRDKNHRPPRQKAVAYPETASRGVSNRAGGTPALGEAARQSPASSGQSTTPH